MVEYVYFIFNSFFHFFFPSRRIQQVYKELEEVVMEVMDETV